MRPHSHSSELSKVISFSPAERFTLLGKEIKLLPALLFIPLTLALTLFISLCAYSTKDMFIYSPKVLKETTFTEASAKAFCMPAESITIITTAKYFFPYSPLTIHSSMQFRISLLEATPYSNFLLALPSSSSLLKFIP